MNNVKSRLFAYINYKNLSVRSFEKEIRASNGFVRNIVQSISPSKIEDITKSFPDLNTGWLLTGEGEMIKKESKTETSDIQSNKVPLLSLSAQGGRLDDFVLSLKNYECEKIISPVKADFAVTISGDSMTPEYTSGYIVLVKKINENAFIEWGRTYVLDTCNGSVIKKVMPGKESDEITCESINEAYPPFSVKYNDIYGMYKVLMCMSIK